MFKYNFLSQKRKKGIVFYLYFLIIFFRLRYLIPDTRPIRPYNSKSSGSYDSGLAEGSSNTLPYSSKLTSAGVPGSAQPGQSI